MQTRQEAPYSARTLLDHFPEVILIYDAEGTLLYVNQHGAAWLGWSVEAVRTKHLRDLVAPSSLALALPPNPLAAGATTRGQPVVYITHTGACRTAEVNISPLTFEGQPAWLAVARDTTERVQQEAARCQSQKRQAVGTLAGGIAHDFNNILVSIIGYSELALEEVPHGSPLERYLTSVLAAGQRACSLVQHMLTFSRQRPLQAQPMLLHLWLSNALAQLQDSLPATVALQRRLTPMTGAVWADPGQLQQVLTHLWSNAEHAMRKTGGVLEVSLDTLEVTPYTPIAQTSLLPGAYVRLQVRDTGHGMAPDVVERIFEPFFTTKAVNEGIGLGLAIVDGIIANHGGAITVSSTPDYGSTFTVYLPRMTPAPTHDLTLAAPPMRADASRALR